MKKTILLGIGGIAIAAVAACGSQSQAYQDGYTIGVGGGSKVADPDFYCGALTLDYKGGGAAQKEFETGCKAGFTKGQQLASNAPTTSDTPYVPGGRYGGPFPPGPSLHDGGF
jgi:hypothetical protein